MTLKFDDVYVGESACVVGPHEKNGPLKEYFDKCYDDFYMGEKSWERAESKLSSESIKILLSKTGLNKEDIDLIIAGDLSNQIASSCYAVLNYNIPFLGIYSACSTSTEGILLASLFVNSKNAKKVIVTVSSHNMASEKQFRNPTEYGAPKPSSSTFTATGGASILITNNKSKVKVDSCTIGRVCDMNQKDANNMGAVMAIAACDTIYKHLKDTKRNASYYDLIITGDLGVYGKKIFLEYMKKNYGIDLSLNHNDSGIMLFDMKNDRDIHAGGSGPVCSPLVNYSYVLPLLKKGKLKHVLIAATGALFSPTSLYQKENILSISHVVSLESVK